MYKIIQNNNIIDVVRFPRFIKFLQNGQIAITDKSTANGIVGSDGETLYSFTTVPENNLNIVSIEKITEEEFKELNSLLANNEIISADISALAKAKRDMISRLSSVCKNKINSGFSIVLSDGKEYSFKLTVEDQLNLMLIDTQLKSGETQFIYHATNQPCRLFNKTDMQKVVDGYKRYVLYHTTYFNAAKQYINKLTDLDKVNMFSYGNNVTCITNDPIVKQILKNGEQV
jgi:hypothetical protein